MIALPGALALIALGRRRREQLLAVVLAIGATAGVVTSQGRGTVVCAVLAVVAYGVLSATTRRQVAAIFGIAVGGLVCFLVVNAIVSNEGASAFRYHGLNPSELIDTTNAARGGDPLTPIIDAAKNYPLGAGLAVAGPASGQAGGTELTGRLDAESEYSFALLETGIIGALLLVGFTLTIIVLGFTRIRRERDPSNCLMLAAIVAPMVGMLALYYPSPISATVPPGPYLWTAGGVVAYWLVTKQRDAARSR